MKIHQIKNFTPFQKNVHPPPPLNHQHQLDMAPFLQVVIKQIQEEDRFALVNRILLKDQYSSLYTYIHLAWKGWEIFPLGGNIS